MNRVLVLVVLLLASCKAAVQENREVQARNVILMIGDGMGISQVTLTRLVHGPLALDEFPVTGLVTTHSASHRVTDSAAAATTLASGKKTTNFTIGKDADGRDVETLLNFAQRQGRATGLMTTTRITHATPAPFATHADSRAKEDEIAQQYATAGVDVLLGGGRKMFSDDLLKKFSGYEIVFDAKAMEAAKGPKLLGLLADDHLPYVLDRRGEPNLAQMTRKALDVLSKNDKGFFLMIEGGRIDMACHSSDAPSCVHETVDFDDAIRVVLEFAKARGDTLVVVTADHATGGLTITEKFQARAEQFKKVRASAEALAERIKKGANLTQTLAEEMGVTDATPEEQAAFDKAQGPYDPAVRIGEIVSKRCGIMFVPFDFRRIPPDDTHGHDGAMVGCYAFGPQASRFTGTFDNTAVFEKIRVAAGY